jgi:hypothetical protein
VAPLLQATRAVPIVFVTTADPVGAGFVDSLARPGGNACRSPEDSVYVLEAFRQGLRETGFVEGHNISIEFRWARGQYQQLPALAAELVSRRVAVLAAVGGDPLKNLIPLEPAGRCSTSRRVPKGLAQGDGALLRTRRRRVRLDIEAVAHASRRLKMHTTV